MLRSGRPQLVGQGAGGGGKESGSKDRKSEGRGG